MQDFKSINERFQRMGENALDGTTAQRRPTILKGTSNVSDDDGDAVDALDAKGYKRVGETNNGLVHHVKADGTGFHHISINYDYNKGQPGTKNGVGAWKHSVDGTTQFSGTDFASLHRHITNSGSTRLPLGKQRPDTEAIETGQREYDINQRVRAENANSPADHRAANAYHSEQGSIADRSRSSRGGLGTRTPLATAHFKAANAHLVALKVPSPRASMRARLASKAVHYVS